MVCPETVPTTRSLANLGHPMPVDTHLPLLAMQALGMTTVHPAMAMAGMSHVHLPQMVVMATSQIQDPPVRPHTTDMGMHPADSRMALAGVLMAQDPGMALAGFPVALVDTDLLATAGPPMGLVGVDPMVMDLLLVPQVIPLVIHPVIPLVVLEDTVGSADMVAALPINLDADTIMVCLGHLVTMAVVAMEAEEMVVSHICRLYDPLDTPSTTLQPICLDGLSPTFPCIPS